MHPGLELYLQLSSRSAANCRPPCVSCDIRPAFAVTCRDSAEVTLLQGFLPTQFLFHPHIFRPRPPFPTAALTLPRLEVSLQSGTSTCKNTRLRFVQQFMHADVEVVWKGMMWMHVAARE